jgi:hypothetical protein
VRGLGGVEGELGVVDVAETSTCGRTPKLNAAVSAGRTADSRERERIREEVRELREITGKIMEGRESHQKPREGSGRRAAPKSSTT